MLIKINVDSAIFYNIMGLMELNVHTYGDVPGKKLVN